MVMSRTVRVIIADDHPVVRKGLRATLDADSAIEVAGAVSSFGQLNELLKTVTADVVLLDLSGMGTPAITAVMTLNRNYPELAIIIYSGSAGSAQELLKLGASGYVDKEDSEDMVIEAIHSVVSGQKFLSPMIQAYLQWAARTRQQQGLTPREWDVLRAVAEGLSSHEMVEQLGMAYQTIRNHIQNIFRKTGCTERTQLVSWYRRFVAEGE